MSNLEKLKLLVWKNYILQRRHKWQTFFEIGAPVLCSLFLILVRCLVDPKYKPANNYNEFSPYYIKPIPKKMLEMNKASNSTSKTTLAYSPNTTMIQTVIFIALQKMISGNPKPDNSEDSSVKLKAPVGFKNAAEMNKALMEYRAMDSYLAGVQFDDWLANESKWPDDVTITLRYPAVMRYPMMEHPIRMSWRTNLLFPVFTPTGPRESDDNFGGKRPGYSQESFLSLQHALSMAVILGKTGIDPEPETKVVMKRYPQHAYRDDFLSAILERFISLIVMVCFAYTASNTVRAVTIEKELQLKETMTVMGLPCWLHWLAWFIKQYSYMFFSLILFTISLKVPLSRTPDGKWFSVITFTSWSVLLFFLCLYMLVSLAFCFMVSVFFKSANTASSFMGLAWFTTYAVYMLTQSIAENISSSVRMVLSLISNAAMGFLLQMIISADGAATGIGWSKMFSPISYNDDYTPGIAIFMMLFDTILYMAIALYVEKIKPGEYGVPLPWNFPFTKEFWMPSKAFSDGTKDLRERTDEEYYASLNGVIHDLEPIGVPIGVNTLNLTKKFGNKTAVKNLNIRMYEGEITVLLGHNGAGKTTTISMLTGSLVPTSGRALVGGYDIVKETKSARHSLGICPQHNVLFPDLTVEEHIIFFASLKGLPQEAIKQEVDYFVNLLDLEDKRKMESEHLSGGQKRRLSVGTAMCGGSKVVLLDEPSSGLDPAARRQLWDLLLREKEGRTMIITTHFMDEADVLADRIAIVSGGKLKCYGTSYFLKKNYGVGYKLIIVKDTGCVQGDVEKFILNYVPEAQANSAVGTEFTYLLPKESVGKFPDLLQSLEVKKHELHVSSYGLNVTTLEEVFMKVGAEDFQCDADLSRVENRRGRKPRNTSISEEVLRHKKVTGLRLIFNHLRAMFIKLFLNTIRSKIMVVIQIISPIINIIISVMISRSWKYIISLPPLILSLESGFKTTETLISKTESLSGKYESIMVQYKKKLQESKYPGLYINDIGTKNISAYYLNIAKKDLERVRFETLVGATFTPEKIISWFSNFCYHDIAISLAMVDDAIFKSFVPNASLKIINYPLPYSIDKLMDVMGAGSNIGFQFSFNICFCLSFVTSFIVLFVIKERISGAKLLQELSSVRPCVLWTCAYIWDFLWLIVISLFIIITLTCFGEPTLSTVDDLGRVFLVLLFMAYSCVPMNYLFSFCFSSAASGFAKMCFINIITGVLPFLIIEVLKVPGLGSPEYANSFDLFFSIIPLYCTARCLRVMSKSGYALLACEAICSQHQNLKNCNLHYVCKNMDIEVCCMSENPYFEWEDPGITRYLVTMAFVGTFCYIILLLKEYHIIQNLFEKAIQKLQHNYGDRYPNLPPNLDDDVIAERNMVDNLSQDEIKEYSLVTKDLTKYYKDVNTVKRLSFTVTKGTCFGLLGVNGAGKTTTFKMLTGDEKISCGNAWVFGYSIRDEIGKVYDHIGYCPQFEALLENLSARETLRIFCLLRGLDTKVGEKLALELVRELGFEKHFNKKVCQCSGGTKRKLSTAVAMLGFARLILLDEPTTGVDPASKRLVWSSIGNATTSGRSLVLSSHSMEECEALCSKLTVMINGSLKCMGSLQHLKNKYSQGYTLIVKCSMDENLDETLEDLGEYIANSFSNISQVETYMGITTYYIKDSGYQWWEIFQIMEKAREEFGIEDYSVTQTTLEQVFMQFTRSEEGGFVET